MIKTPGLFIVLYFSTSVSFANATKCDYMFIRPPAKAIAEHIQFAEEASEDIKHFQQYLGWNYQMLQKTVTLRDRNDLIKNIISTNNNILDIIERTILAQDIFNTGAKRIIQKQVKAKAIKALELQDLSEEFIQNIINTRLDYVKKLAANKPAKNPMGFIWDSKSSNEQSDDITKKTIGFLQVARVTNMYGRATEKSKEAPRSHHLPIGFTTEKKSPDQIENQMSSIGFQSATETQDVSYRLGMGFNFEESIFVAVSTQQPIGFTK